MPEVEFKHIYISNGSSIKFSRRDCGINAEQGPEIYRRKNIERLQIPGLIVKFNLLSGEIFGIGVVDWFEGKIQVRFGLRSSRGCRGEGVITAAILNLKIGK